MTCNREKMRACIYGLAVGDALGVPYEFRERDTFRCDGMAGGGIHGQLPGTWSDDTSMALCIAASLKELGHVDAEDISERFHDWYIRGEYTCDGKVFDIGITCARAITTGMPAYSFEECGNGSLMRTAPIAMLSTWSDSDVQAVSAITHAHSVAEWSCVALCDMLQDLACYGKDGIYRIWQRYGFIAGLPRDAIESDGYCVHTLGAAIWCLCNTGSYRECVLAAVNLGGDSDTTAAVAGAMAGVAYGYDAIPADWIEQLRGKATIDACVG